jgi:DNA-binding MarR family transcriptional regulator
MCVCTHRITCVHTHTTGIFADMPARSTADRDERGQRAWGGLLHVYADLVPVLDRELRRTASLPLAWYDVLLELNAAPDRRLQMGQLGEKVVLSRTRVSRLVDDLERGGLVSRASNPADGRSAYAEITKSGRDRLRAAAPVYLAAIHEYFSRHLTQRELDHIGSALWRVHAAYERARK